MLANPKLLCFVQFSCIVHCASNVCMKNTTKVINSYFKYKISLAIFFSFLKVTCFIIFLFKLVLVKRGIKDSQETLSTALEVQLSVGQLVCWSVGLCIDFVKKLPLEE